MTDKQTYTRLDLTMLRIREPERSLAFCCDVPGREPLEKFDFEKMGFSLYFLGSMDDLDGERPGDADGHCVEVLSPRDVRQIIAGPAG